MSNYFEKVNKYSDNEFQLPERGTTKAAGYDFYCPSDVIIPSFVKKIINNQTNTFWDSNADQVLSLENVKKIIKSLGLSPTLVPTGVKCHLDKNKYLELSVRSSTPLKYLLFCANGIGIIDSDYYNNPDNEGEIFFQIINLSPYDIKIHKGDKIG